MNEHESIDKLDQLPDADTAFKDACEMLARLEASEKARDGWYRAWSDARDDAHRLYGRLKDARARIVQLERSERDLCSQIATADGFKKLAQDAGKELLRIRDGLKGMRDMLLTFSPKGRRATVVAASLVLQRIETLLTDATKTQESQTTTGATERSD